MNTNRCHILSPLAAVTVIMAVTFSSCGSKKGAVRPAVSPPRDVPEISLEQLIGSGSYVVTPEVDLSDQARALVKAAHGWLGTPYQYGGETHRGIDCSALVMNVYKEALGMKLPRTSATQRQFASRIDRGGLSVGDLVFFTSNKSRGAISHVGIYIGNDRFIHASSSRGVVVSRLSDRYFVDHYHSAGRVLKSGDTTGRLTSLAPAAAVPLEDMMEQNLDLLDQILTATIDSIYSIVPDDDPNIAPGL